jgi:bifunctional DNA-binding transcriptional regulator/antitoxin component of YhaV-PrlF toxin-antitoxin module
MNKTSDTTNRATRAHKPARHALVLTTRGFKRPNASLRLLIPQPVLQHLGWRAGTRLKWRARCGELIMRPLRQARANANLPAARCSRAERRRRDLQWQQTLARMRKHPQYRRMVRSERKTGKPPGSHGSHRSDALDSLRTRQMPTGDAKAQPPPV